MVERIGARHFSTSRAIHMAIVISSAAACSPATALRGPSPAAAALVFENATVDEVAVYIDHAGSRWILGHVQPGRSSRLRVPDFAKLRNLSDVRLIVVPLGSTRDGPRGIDIANAICSEVGPATQMVTMRWSLTGHTLVSSAASGSR